MADGYVTFVRHSQDMLREKVNEEMYVERLFDVSTPFSIRDLTPPYRAAGPNCIQSSSYFEKLSAQTHDRLLGGGEVNHSCFNQLASQPHDTVCFKYISWFQVTSKQHALSPNEGLLPLTKCIEIIPASG